MRKFFLKALIFILATMACVFVGCKDNCGEDNGVTVEQFLEVLPQKAELVLGDSKQLSVDLSPQEGAQLTFLSKDESIASVSNKGEITANRLGQTTIDVVYGDLKKEVSVSVTDGGYLPSLRFTDITEEATIDLNNSFALSAYVLFNGQKFDDPSVRYAVSDASVAKVEEGVLVPLKKGEVSVTATATWRGFENLELTKEFKVNIVEIVNVAINDGQAAVDIYARNLNGNQSVSTTLRVKVYGNDEATPRLSVVSGEECITLDNYTVNAVKAGTAVIKAVYAKEGVEYWDTITVNVLRPVVEIAEPIQMFSALDGVSFGERTLTEVVEEYCAFNEITSATQGEVELTVENGSIKGVVPDIVKDSNGYATQINNVTLTLYSGSIALRVTVQAYTKVINDAEDLAAVYGATNVERPGYYIVQKSFDANGYVLSGSVSNTANGLSGTFDGNGQTISNLKTAYHGIF